VLCTRLEFKRRKPFAVYLDFFEFIGLQGNLSNAHSPAILPQACHRDHDLRIQKRHAFGIRASWKK